ncbi:Nuclear control of ATPase protein 2 [Tulasnella sp. JGI-2019a]|nr:Nuclear control of ATPase protein 2 [Tulasnella sp. JGI-2019a]KAG9014168.1 Nuclear control of ATPase protein 2 [Tulasnella sp. JGI-2019a]
MSVFLTHHTQSLLQTSLPPSVLSADANAYTARQDQLHGLLIELDKPLKRDALLDVLRTLTNVATEAQFQHSGDETLAWAALNRSTVAVYLQVMEVLLSQAARADEEAEWWRLVEQKGGGTAWYLLQTFPSRLKELSNQMLRTIRSHNRPISLSIFTPSSFDQLFPSIIFNKICKDSFFPHLQHPYNIFRTNPIELARQECRAKRLKLEKLRDQRAERLGVLSNLRAMVYDTLANNGLPDEVKERIATIVGLLEWSLTDDESALEDTQTKSVSLSDKRAQLQNLPGPEAIRRILPQLQDLLSTRIQINGVQHDFAFVSLQRPSRLTQLWPKLVFLPPLAYLAFKVIFNSRAQLYATLADAKATAIGFWHGWVLEPIRGIIETVRTGSDTAVVISKEGLKSDLDSLERMATALAKEKLKFTPAQLEELSAQVRQGDLTSVLKIYENDIKSPISSALTGSLIRTLLIQVQKVKVDVDLAASGIDKLLRSQELTFAFVGVAPSITILYVFGNWLKTVWTGSSGRGRFGGRQRRERVWIAIRRIERLLNALHAEPTPSVEAIVQQSTGRDESLPPSLTTGLLLLSINHLRSYGVAHLPPRSQLQMGFLEDVDDLEDAESRLSKAERLVIVQRMWRSWGRVLGWDRDVVGLR